MSDENKDIKNYSTMSKKSKYLLLLVIFLVIAIASACYSFYSIHCLKNEPAIFNHQLYSVKNGYTAFKVVEDFTQSKAQRIIFKLYLKAHPKYFSILKGDYLVDGKKSLLALLEDMIQGNVVEKIYPTFAIVEGSNFAKILSKIKQRKYQDGKFYSLVNNEKSLIEEALKEKAELLEFIGGAKKSIEGLVSPATYPMYEKDPFYHMIKSGLIKQLRYLKKEWDNRVDHEYIKTPYDALILASLIEKETFLDEERAMVSAVFLNRLKAKMRLQTDPSVMYGVSKIFIGKLTKKQLKEDTPYNTYTREGLPPTPICMPSEKSIYAALHPEEIEALYFVAKTHSPKDGHEFTNNLKDHNKAVKAYRKKVKEYKASLKVAQKAKDTKEDENDEDDEKDSD